MRQALNRIDVHNPLVEPERPGYAVRHKLHGWWWTDKGWQSKHEHVKVYGSLSAAAYAAGMLAGAQVTSVPRVIGEMSVGPLVVWTEVST
jgi:hypothetical protein